jgi:hypothetical protein
MSPFLDSVTKYLLEFFFETGEKGILVKLSVEHGG